MLGVILPAAGASQRFGAAKPKTLALLGGRPLVAWALEPFFTLSQPLEVVVVVPAPWRTEFSKVLPGIRLVDGGPTRSQSVLRGLAALSPGADPILVHDAARPLLEAGTVRRVLDAIAVHGAAIAALPAVDSVHVIEEETAEGPVAVLRSSLSREQVRLAQTPQGARRELLMDALQREEDFSDEAAALRAAGHRVVAVPGSLDAFKITTPGDLARAEARVRARS